MTKHITIRRDPFGLVFGDILESFVREVPVHERMPQTGFPPMERIRKEDGTEVLKFACAGYPSDKLNVETQGSTLIVSADKVNDKEEGEGLRRIALRSFRHSFHDSSNEYDLESLKASYINGILRVEIPKREEEKPKKFKILTKTGK